MIQVNLKESPPVGFMSQRVMTGKLGVNVFFLVPELLSQADLVGDVCVERVLVARATTWLLLKYSLNVSIHYMPVL